MFDFSPELFPAEMQVIAEALHINIQIIECNSIPASPILEQLPFPTEPDSIPADDVSAGENLQVLNSGQVHPEQIDLEQIKVEQQSTSFRGESNEFVESSSSLQQQPRNSVSYVCVQCKKVTKYLFGGSGCGTVGRAVAYDTRGPGFESSHRQLLLNIYLLLTVCRKDENKEKEAGNGPSFKKTKYLISNKENNHNVVVVAQLFFWANPGLF